LTDSGDNGFDCTDSGAFLLRDTYVVDALRAGDDVKTVQASAGHYSAAFTLDRYAHVTASMQRESAARMQSFLDSL